MLACTCTSDKTACKYHVVNTACTVNLNIQCLLLSQNKNKHTETLLLLPAIEIIYKYGGNAVENRKIIVQLTW
jgi:hypothetical protein